jgi:ribosome biogenesis GTPase
MLISGKVITTTRRSAHVMIETVNGTQIINASISNQIRGICVGDVVSCSLEKEYNLDHLTTRKNNDNRGLLRTIKPRHNCLFRSYGNKRKNVCANVDLALIITAPGILGNTIFIDRILCTCTIENIPTALIINKSDLQEPTELLEIYSGLDTSIIVSSAETGEGISIIHNLLMNHELNTVVLCGISGVGKSSLVNVLMPDVSRRIQEVSRKTGQGQQTTSQAEGFLMSRDGCNPLLVVDTPGVQNFGLSHLSEEECRAGFSDLSSLGAECEFRNCKHIEEKNCAVLSAIENDELPITRYESYLNVLHEIELAKKYKYS